MNVRKHNRLYFFIAGYTLVFGFLASFGYIGITNIQKDIKRKHELAETGSLKTFYTLPRIDLTVGSFAGEMHHARIGISLEMDMKNLDQFEDFQPRVSDRIVDFLRQQNIEDIRRPSKSRELRHDLLHEINAASGPVKVSDVIFREFVVR
ncbi:MAG: flagellar basal body-associated FliL family protein [Pseudomonadota bacterium]|nr:flagellar basal body-associated FliL family protein [Pseudomonadota bacterium]